VDLVERQIALFEAENQGLISDTEAALASYNRAPRDEAEERYGDYLDLVETGTDELVELRTTSRPPSTRSRTRSTTRSSTGPSASGFPVSALSWTSALRFPFRVPKECEVSENGLARSREAGRVQACPREVAAAGSRFTYFASATS